MISAVATGGTGVYTYAWDCNYNQFGGSNFQPGSATQQCSWTTNGGHTPGVKVTDTGTGSAIVYGNVTITGGTTTLSASVSGPSTGAVSTPYTYFATASGGMVLHVRVGLRLRRRGSFVRTGRLVDGLHLFLERDSHDRGPGDERRRPARSVRPPFRSAVAQTPAAARRPRSRVPRPARPTRA